MQEDTRHTNKLFEPDLLLTTSAQMPVSSTVFANTTTSNTHVSNIISTTISLGMIMIVFITMVSLGCTMELAKIKEHMRRPKGVAIAVLSQYGVMPLTGFGLAKALQLAPMEAVAVLVCGCCPGGNLSNILTLALQGDMNLSIVMTASSSLLALGMMPLLLFLYIQGFPGLHNAVPYGGITLTLIMTLIPCAIGIYLKHRFPSYSRRITKVGMCIMLVATGILFFLVVINVRKTIVQLLVPRLLITASMMPLIGYIFGYILSAVFGLQAK